MSELMNKEEICTTYHYGILFKVLALMPKILKSCPIPYIVGGGTAIVKYLNNRGIKPKITDKWDSYDWDVYTNDIEAMKDYIIKSLTKKLIKKTQLNDEQKLSVKSVSEVINATRITNKGKSGYQLSLDVCYRIDIPSSFSPDEDEQNVTYKLQFMDIFSEDVLVKVGAFKGVYVDRIVIDGVNYYTPEKMWTKLNEAITDRSRNGRERIVGLDYEKATQELLLSLNRLTLRFKKILSAYLDNLQKKNEMSEYEDKLNEVTEDLHENYEKVLLPHFSYRNVAQYIKLKLEVEEELDKLTKMRLRAQLLSKVAEES